MTTENGPVGAASDAVTDAQAEALERREFGVPLEDGDRIAARGAWIVLAVGTKVHIRFDFAHLRAVERRLGSIAALADAIALPFGDQQANAVAHVVSIFTGLALEQVDQLIDPRQLPVYCQAIDLALDEALPPRKEAPAPGPKRRARKSSTGRGSTS